MSNTSPSITNEELWVSNTELKAQVEYLAKQVAQLTKLKMNVVNALEESDEEKEEVRLEADFSHTTGGTAQEKGATDFKIRKSRLWR
ncbi:unnamed protein product [Cuscuta campestris]|uniref:Uncharacterized protein n=1 Tax=Cuscuta campestris TaxID=132261 RepID=A0A484N750_9ASTE|nr:unnamed protein product [Cuscuta campestris]